MKRILGHVVSLLVTALAVSAVVPACADNDQSIFIRGALAPAQNRQNGACLYTDDPTQATLFEGSLDVGVRDNYLGAYIVGNQMIPRGDPQNVRAESNRAHINGGIVRVTRTDGTTIREFTAFATGFADPQNNNNPDFGVMGLITIDAPTALILRDELVAQARAQNVNVRSLSTQVLANIKVIGKTLGGVDLESAEYQFPIRVCVGCLVFFPPGVNDTSKPANEQPNCFLAPSQQSTNANQSPCFNGQDEAVSCRSCSGRPFCDRQNPP